MPDEMKPDLRRLGTSGLPVWSGRVYDEALRDLAGEKGRIIFRQMSEQDPVIGGIMLGIEMIARQVNWSIKPADDSEKATEVAEFVDSALTDMSPSFGMTLSEIFSMLVYGWSWLEIVYKRREGLNLQDQVKSSQFDDGKIGWGGWQIRSQETLDGWEFGGERNLNDAHANNGPLTAMWQMDPNAAGNAARVRIPRQKALHFTTRSRRENPEGVSLLRNAYSPWYRKNHIETIEGIGVERDLAGMPVMWVPQELFSSSASTEQQALFARLQTLVTSIKRDEQEGILMPMAYDEEKNPIYKLELLSTAGERQFDTNNIIQRYDERIAMSMLADFILMGHSGVGSYALSSSKTNMFSTAMSTYLDIIADEVNDAAVPKLVVLNGWPLKMCPTITHGKVEAADIAKVADYLNSLNAAGMTVFPNVTLEKFLLETAGLPGGQSIVEAGEWPLDPVTGLPTRVPAGTDPEAIAAQRDKPNPVDPNTGLPTGAPTPIGKSPNNKTDVGARRQAPRDIAIRRETARGKKAATEATGEEPETIKAHTTTKHHRHFVPLSTRVSKLSDKLHAALGDEAYRELLAEVMAKGKFSRLSSQAQQAIIEAEGRGSVQS